MSIEYRLARDEDLEALAPLESRAFYGEPQPGDPDLLRKFTKPEWTVAAFDGSRPIADVRTVPSARLMHGTRTPFGCIGPVTCEAAYRRQGHVGKLLKMSLELMRERGQPLSGLYTPHDALYRRSGYERAEEKRRLRFDPHNIQFRVKPTGGRTAHATKDDWDRLDRIYMEQATEANGRLQRNKLWWQYAILTDIEAKEPIDRNIVVWLNDAGEDRGYVVYQNRPTGNRDGGWARQEVWIRDMTALDHDAYLGLWSHMLTHDLAEFVTCDAHPDDPFYDLCEDPFAVTASRAEGPMIRIVDIEKAIEARPYLGQNAVSFTMHIADKTAPWNEGTWRVEAADGSMRAEKTTDDPDIETAVNFLAPLYTGFRPPQLLADVGMITVHNTDALPAIAEVFSVRDAPYVQDFY
jgi:predicted acetyltransferase